VYKLQTSSLNYEPVKSSVCCECPKLKSHEADIKTILMDYVVNVSDIMFNVLFLLLFIDSYCAAFLAY